MQYADDFNNTIGTHSIINHVALLGELSVSFCYIIALNSKIWIFRKLIEAVIKLFEVGIPLLNTPFLLSIPTDIKQVMNCLIGKSK